MYTSLISLTSRGRFCAHADMPIRLEGQNREDFQFLVNDLSILWITKCLPAFVRTAVGSRRIFVEAVVVSFTGIVACPSLFNAEAPFAEITQGT